MFLKSNLFSSEHSPPFIARKRMIFKNQFHRFMELEGASVITGQLTSQPVFHRTSCRRHTCLYTSRSSESLSAPWQHIPFLVGLLSFKILLLHIGNICLPLDFFLPTVATVLYDFNHFPAPRHNLSYI